MKNTGIVRTVPLTDFDDQLDSQDIQNEEEFQETSKFIFSEEVQAIAAKLISKYHTHLAEAKIAYLFRTDEWKGKGKTIFGKAYKAPEQWKFMSGYELLVVISRSAWGWLDEKQQQALVDHELCHFEKDIDTKGNPKWSLVSHDVEEFAAVIARHGLWSVEAQQFFRVAKEQQMNLEDFSQSS